MARGSPGRSRRRSAFAGGFSAAFHGPARGPGTLGHGAFFLALGVRIVESGFTLTQSAPDEELVEGLRRRRPAFRAVVLLV